MKTKKLLLIVFGIKSLFIIVCIFSLYFKWNLQAQRWFNTGVPFDNQMIVAIKAAPDNEIDSYNLDGFTGLMIAAAKGYIDVAKAFLERHANPFLQQHNSFFGYTPFHLAIINGTNDASFAVAKFLIDFGIPIYIRDQINETAMHVALQVQDQNKRMAIMDYLIDEGIQINAQDRNGNTIMHNAVQNQDKIWILNFRKKYGNLINTEIKNNLGYTALQHATYLGFDDDVDSPGASLRAPVTLIGLGELGYQDVDATGRTALMYALYRGDLALAKKYIERGASLTAQDNNGLTAYYYAMIGLQPIEAVKMLFAANAPVNTIDKKGRTLLFTLTKVEQPQVRLELAKLLLEKGLSPDAKDAQGMTVAQRLAPINDRALLELLKPKK